MCVAKFGGGTAKLELLQASKGGSGSTVSDVLDTGNNSEKQVSFVASAVVEFRDSPSYVRLQGSDNKSSWTNIKSFSFSVNGPFQGCPMSAEIVTTSYRYLRINLSNANGGSASKGAFAVIKN